MSTLPPIDIPGTLPEDWTQLLNMIQAMLPAEVDVSSLVITSNGDLVNYLTGETYTPIYTMQEVLTGWAKVGGANPADTTAVAIRPITDIVAVTGGTAVKDIVSGKGSFGMVKKGIILGSLMALFVSTLTPAASLEDIEEDLLFTLDPYTVDGENIPVYIDENGATHVSENLMNTIRETLINLGVYQSGGDPSVNPGSVSGLNHPGAYNNPVYFSDGVSYFQEYRPRTSATYDFILTSGNPCRGILYRANNVDPSASGLLVYSTSDFTFTRYTGGAPAGEYPASSTTVDGVTYYYYRSGPSSGGTNQWSFVNVTGTINAVDLSATTANGNMYDFIKLGVNAAGGGGGVEGLDVTGKTDFGNTSLSLEDIIQGLAQRYITIANPTDEDIFNKDKWYELNLNSDDVWTDGLTSDQTDPVTNTQGETDDDTKDEIIDKLLDIIRDITGNPDLPDIPAGDSGDTPSAEPPILDGSSNGLWTIYNPTKQEVQSFGAWLWSSNIIDQIVRQFNSPIDAIIGFHQIYCTPSTGSSKIIKAGYLDSPVSALEVTNQYTEINCGEVDVNEYYGNALDYDNTQVSIYLPFVGIVPLDTNIIMGSTLEVIYRIDVFTGTCLAQIKVKKQNSNAVMYAFEGNCAVQIPLTATTYTGMVGALISGISAGVSFMAGDMLHATTAGVSAAISAMGGKTGTKQSGSMGSNAGALGIRVPYLIITRSASAMPAGFENLAGLPSTELTALTSVSGFTVVRNVHLEGIPGTAEELEEIKSLLESGVIF